MIRLEQLNKSYLVGARPLHVLKQLDLTIEEGEYVSIMGSSGSGKSTLLNVLGILDDYDGGAYYLDDTLVRDLSERKRAQLRNLKLGFVFQSFHLLPYKNAEENIALPLYYQGVRRKERRKRARELLERVGLLEWADHVPAEMSGGQKQRIAIARALVTNPSVILADEPTGALDTTTSYQIMDLLDSVHAQGTTIVVVTHEPDIAERTERVVRLRDGVIAEDTGRKRAADA